MNVFAIYRKIYDLTKGNTMNKKTKQDNQTSTPEDEYEKIQQAILMREVE